MEKYLEELLEFKSKESNCEILYSVWKRDKKPVTEILSFVSVYFCNYTDHSANHSRSILDSIGRIVGREALSSFSPTDLWLLLSSAYYHDIGMVLFNGRIKKIISNSEEKKKFIAFIRECQEDKDPSAHKGAELFTIKDNDNLYFKKTLFQDDTISLLTSVFAEYTRKYHPEESQKFIEDEIHKNEDSLFSVTSQIPSRIYHVLGLICKVHGDDEKELFKLPQKEDGLGQFDYCHPLLIACLLRLGDLLDLDNNRIAPAAISFYGKDNFPEISLEHIRKHRSIDHIAIDSKEISIHATIRNFEKSVDIEKDKIEEKHQFYGTYEITKEWFSWIEKELKNQKNKWKTINPDVYNFSLPDIKSLDVVLKDYITLGDNHPQFSVNSKQVFGLLKGYNLYESPWVAVREVLQNAVDATLIECWQEKKDEGHQGSKEKEESDEVVLDFSKHAIEVHITPKDKNDEQSYRIEIFDHGTGIDKENLKYLLKVGSGKENKEKEKIVREMPDKYKPSGSFGIGFQSLFMLTDEVTVETFTYNDGYLDMEFHSPTKYEGQVFIKEPESHHHSSSFTKITFDLDKSKILDSIKADTFNDDDDPFSNDGDTPFLNSFLIQLKAFKKYALVPIKVYFKNSEVKMDVKDSDKNTKFDTYYDVIIQTKEDEKCSVQKTDEDKKVLTQINIRKSLYPYSGTTKFYYRNQFVKNLEEASFPYIDIDVNVISGNAKDWLSMNRNEVSAKHKNDMNSVVKGSLQQLFSDSKFKNDPLKYVGKLDNSGEFLNQLCLIYAVFLSPQEKDSTMPEEITFEGTYNYNWCKVVIPKLECKSLKQIFDSCISVVFWNGSDSQKHLEYDSDKKKLILPVGDSENYNLELMLRTIIKKYYSDKKILYTLKDCQFNLSFTFNKGTKFFKDDKTDGGKFLSNIRKYIDNEKHLKSRYLIPCPEKYDKLSINTLNTEMFIEEFLPFDSDSTCPNLTVSPFVKDEKVSEKKDIPDSLLKFIIEHPGIKNENKEEQKNDKERILDEFKKKEEVRKQYIEFIGELARAEV